MMSIYVRHTAFLLATLFTTNLGAMHNATLLHILKTLEDGRCTTIEHAQNQALHITSLKQKPSNQDIDCLINILIFGNRSKTVRFDHIASRIPLIDSSIKAFSDTPGFAPLIRHLLLTSLNETKNKSPWYQLAAAYYMYNNLYTHIQAFSCPSDYGSSLKHANSYGVISETQWAFCKTVQWDTSMYNHGRGKKNLRKSILQQRDLVNTYNHNKDHELQYTICSQYQPSPYWSGWTAVKQIPILFIPL